jgi:hypothetical protein
MARSSVLARAGRVAAVLLTTPGPRPSRIAALWLIPFAAAALLACPRWFQRVPFTPDGHAYISLGEALNARYCGKPGQLAPRHNIGAVLSKEPLSILTPFPELLAARAGSLEAYCRAVDLEFLNNENSMMLLMRAGLRLVPRVSAARLGRWLALLRFVILLIFAFALLDCGVAIPLALFAFLVACDVSNDLRFLQFSIYSFFIPLLLLMPSLYALALRHVAPRGAWWRAASFVGAGFLTAFCANMRSSHLPVYVAMFAIYVVCARRFSARRWVAYAAGAAVCFALAYLAFGRILILPLVPQHPSGYFNYSHHVIAHPLVLGLALPPSDLSRREGIQWEDSIGLDLARRMVPDAVYLGPGYEEGLFLYYVKLWLVYPAEMRAIYRSKLDLAGTGLFENNSTNARQRVIGFLTSIGRIRSGEVLLTIACLAFAAAAALYAWRRLLPAFLLALLSLAGAFLLLESAIIIPTFYLQYHGYLVVYAATLIGVAGQLAVDAAGAAIQRLFAPPRVTASV